MDTVDHETSALDTRTRLILAAERLFGERGIDAVPLREVVAAAGQRNASALSYHIGGREELVLAIFEYRRADVDTRRMALLDEYAAAGVEMDERAVAAGVIIPLVELMLRDKRGGDYVRLLSQAFVTERPESAYRSIGRHDRGLRRCGLLYRARHPELPARLVREQYVVCWRGAMFALSDWQRDAALARSGTPRSPLPDFAGDLITMTARALACIGERERRFVPFVTPRAGMQQAAD